MSGPEVREHPWPERGERTRGVAGCYRRVDIDKRKTSSLTCELLAAEFEHAGGEPARAGLHTLLAHRAVQLEGQNVDFSEPAGDNDGLFEGGAAGVPAVAFHVEAGVGATPRRGR